MCRIFPKYFRRYIFLFGTSRETIGIPLSLLNVSYHVTNLSDFLIEYMSKWSDWKPVQQQNRTKSYCLYRHRHCESSNQTWCDEKTIEIKNCTSKKNCYIFILFRQITDRRQILLLILNELRNLFSPMISSQNHSIVCYCIHIMMSALPVEAVLKVM